MTSILSKLTPKTSLAVPAPIAFKWPIILIIIACTLPFFVSDYRTLQFTQVLIYAIAILGLNILTGYNGQISLGHGAFYAVGAYTAAILMDKFGVPY
ncbi:MAG: branched-chain amino acid ABC transporter permease, partial [Burkholderiales bacterium]